jgi:hypothetical protein
MRQVIPLVLQASFATAARRLLHGLLVIAVCLPWSLTSGAAAFDEYPSTGIAYNTKERSALTYECELESMDQLKCSFVQMALRRKLNPSSLPEQLAKMEKQLASEKWDSKDCAEQKQLLSALNAKAVPNFAKMDQRDVAHYQELLESSVKACESGSTSPMLPIMRKSLELETRSCRISSNKFEQTFKRVQSASIDKPVWVTTQEPTGPCGIVQLSRFELVKPSGDDFKAWNYIARKAITNPDAEEPFLGKCGGLDEGSYVFSWDESDGPSSWANCDQIEFGY